MLSSHQLITIFDAAHDPAFIIIVLYMIDRTENGNYHHTHTQAGIAAKAAALAWEPLRCSLQGLKHVYVFHTPTMTEWRVTGNPILAFNEGGKFPIVALLPSSSSSLL